MRTGDKDIHQNDRVFLGFAGREFRCRLENDNNANPFHRRNQAVTLTFGAASNVEDSEINNPRDPVMDFADATNFPVYLRTEPNIRKDWEIVSARVETSPSTSIFSLKYPRIVLSDDSGERVALV